LPKQLTAQNDENCQSTRRENGRKIVTASSYADFLHIFDADCELALDITVTNGRKWDFGGGVRRVS